MHKCVHGVVYLRALDEEVVGGDTNGDDALDGFVLRVVDREAEGLPNLKITTFQSNKNQRIIKFNRERNGQDDLLSL